MSSENKEDQLADPVLVHTVEQSSSEDESSSSSGGASRRKRRGSSHAGASAGLLSGSGGAMSDDMPNGSAGSGAGENASGDNHDRAAQDHSEAHPHARSMLIVFTTCNLLTYFDRGSIGVCMANIMKPEVYNLSNFEGGVLAGAYMVGYITASPLFALAVRKYDPFRLIAFGLAIWALAAVGCGASIGFVSLLLARAVSGIGEAAFLCIAPPFIDKCAPSDSKSRWMAIFYCAIPVGWAMGFVISGHWLNFYLVPIYYQWRFIFLAEAVCMIPFILWCLATETPPHNFKDPPPSRQHRLDELNEPVSYRPPAYHQGNGGAPPQNSDNEFHDYLETVGEVLQNKVYMLIILGYAAQTFVLGSVAYFGIPYLISNFGYSIGKAGSYFGGITVVVGVMGSLFGGWLCDHIRRGKNKAHATAVTMKLAFILISIAFPLCLASFLKNTPTYFFTIFVVAEFILFATASPINSAVIWSVPFRLSPLACSLSIMFIHILGDAISPAIVGAILDATNQNWTLTMGLNTCWLIWSVFFWFWAWRAAEAKAKMIDEEMIARGMGEAGPNSNFASPHLGPALEGGNDNADDGVFPSLEAEVEEDLVVQSEASDANKA